MKIEGFLKYEIYVFQPSSAPPQSIETSSILAYF